MGRGWPPPRLGVGMLQASHHASTGEGVLYLCIRHVITAQQVGFFSSGTTIYESMHRNAQESLTCSCLFVRVFLACALPYNEYIYDHSYVRRGTITKTKSRTTTRCTQSNVRVDEAPNHTRIRGAQARTRMGAQPNSKTALHTCTGQPIHCEQCAEDL